MFHKIVFRAVLPRVRFVTRTSELPWIVRIFPQPREFLCWIQLDPSRQRCSRVDVGWPSDIEGSEMLGQWLWWWKGCWKKLFQVVYTCELAQGHWSGHDPAISALFGGAQWEIFWNLLTYLNTYSMLNNLNYCRREPPEEYHLANLALLGCCAVAEPRLGAFWLAPCVGRLSVAGISAVAVAGQSWKRVESCWILNKVDLSCHMPLYRKNTEFDSVRDIVRSQSVAEIWRLKYDGAILLHPFPFSSWMVGQQKTTGSVNLVATLNPSESQHSCEPS